MNIIARIAPIIVHMMLISEYYCAYCRYYCAYYAY